MSHLNEDPLVSPRSALIFRAQILGKSPSGRAKFNRKVRYPGGVSRVRKFVPRHRSGPAWSPVFMGASISGTACTPARRSTTSIGTATMLLLAL